MRHVGSIKWGVLVALCGIAGICTAADKSPHSKVVVTQRFSGETLALEFKVQAAAGLQLNLEAPWQLSLDEEQGLHLEAHQFAKKDFDGTKGQFNVKATRVKGVRKDKSVRYKLVVFTCSKDKSQCFREVLQAKVKII